ncbi:hypothetical protein P3F83_07760 [Mycobacteroides immunogenum]|uniref:hypothetical protein n=1 Tax=Mycobacteroides immunogenum TaxID=83262 RepID=UPI0025B7A2B6|nr:hypothetical protein [Mycobacteroides immunogenum]WJR35256.1 hypothetical protein P3F83_07760 [Mycobacteroides immunogenum]
MSAFATASAACTALSEAMEAAAAAISVPIDGWKGAAADNHIEGMAATADTLHRGADDLTTTAAACDGQDSADGKLMQHPSPEEVREAESKADQLAQRVLSGEAELEPAAVKALDDAKALREERDAALAEHTSATSQTVIPEGSSGTDGSGGNTGDGGITKGEDTDDEDAGRGNAGEDGEEIGDGEDGDRSSTAPSPTTRSGDTSPVSNGSPVSDTSAPASTSLSGDNSVSTQPTTSLSAAPGAQPQTASATGGSPSPSMGGGGGGSAPSGMLSSQSTPQRGSTSGNRQQGRTKGGDQEIADQRKDLDALIAPFAAPVHGGTSVPLSGSPSGTGSVSTTPSGAGTTAPAAGAAQPAPGNTPAAGGPSTSPTAGTMGSTLGSGNGAIGGQPKPADQKVSAKPAAPSQEFLDKLAESRRDDDKDKKAS